MVCCRGREHAPGPPSSTPHSIAAPLRSEGLMQCPAPASSLPFVSISLVMSLPIASITRGSCAGHAHWPQPPPYLCTLTSHHARANSSVMSHAACKHETIHMPQCRQARRHSISVHAVPIQQQETQPQQQPGPDMLTLQLSGQETPQELLALLQSANSGCTCSPETCASLQAAITPSSMANMPVKQLADLLLAISATCTQLSPAWLDTVLEAAHTHITQSLTEDDTSQLAALLWAVSELGCNPGASWLSAVSTQMMQGLQAGSFFAADLATSVCALGSLGFKPDQATTSALSKEIQLQVSEFLNDFQAQDVARLASGIADLHIAAAFPAEFRTKLMKAVYSKVRTIEDKAAVDFALSKLDSDEKSMHYDPRWTHEELNWLPRRERDKRRIMKETWQRSQWGGWA